MKKQRRIKPYLGFNEDVRDLYGKQVVVYGPYVRNSDGRRIVVIHHFGPKLLTKLYAKVKLEIKIGRILSKEETVDHSDGDPENDKFSNLELLSRKANASKSAIRKEVPEFVCAWCKVMFIPKGSQHNKRANNYAGPFCSRSCQGKYGKQVQETGSIWERTKQKKVEYFTLNNNGKKTFILFPR